MPVKTPAETAQTALGICNNKVALSQNPGLRFAALAVIAGAYIALGGTLSVMAGYGLGGASAANPALQKLVSGAVFPIGLILIVVLGGELFTGNNALLMPGVVMRKVTVWQTLKNWTLVWLGNFAGALAVLFVLVRGVGLFEAEPWHTAVVNMAVAKTQMPFWVVFAKGIGANWCVCLAVWMALSARRFAEKALACWIPVAAFVVLGYEHCIANMFFIPCGMAYGADVSIGTMMSANLLPATLGNIVGGALPVGALHSWLHMRRG